MSDIRDIVDIGKGSPPKQMGFPLNLFSWDYTE